MTGADAAIETLRQVDWWKANGYRAGKVMALFRPARSPEGVCWSEVARIALRHYCASMGIKYPPGLIGRFFRG